MIIIASAEAFPLYIRDFGMSYATAVCWFFKLSIVTSILLSIPCVVLRHLCDSKSTGSLSRIFVNIGDDCSFILAITFPLLLNAFTPQGAFGWYGASKVKNSSTFCNFMILINDCVTDLIYFLDYSWLVYDWLGIGTLLDVSPFVNLDRRWLPHNLLIYVWLAIRPETKALTLEELDYGMLQTWVPRHIILCSYVWPDDHHWSLNFVSTVFSVPTAQHASYQLKNAVYHVRKYVFRQRVEPLPPLYVNCFYLYAVCDLCLPDFANLYHLPELDNNIFLLLVAIRCKNVQLEL